MSGLFGKVGRFLTDNLYVTNPDGFADHPMTVSSYDFRESLRRCSNEDERKRYAHGMLGQYKQDFKHPNLGFASLKAMLRQCLMCHSLGIDVSFCSFYAITLVQSATSLSDKRFGYTMCQALLTEQSDLTIMLISVLQQDICSRDPAVICLALECCSYLVGAEDIPSVLRHILDRTKYPHPHVRRNAFCCLSTFILNSPSLCAELTPYFKMALTDKNPSVMFQAIQGYVNLCKSGQTCDTRLIKPLMFVLQQIIEKKLPAGISRHEVNGFYIALKIIQLLRLLNKQSSFDKDSALTVSFKLVTLLDQLDTNTSLTSCSVKAECCYCLLELSHHVTHDSINSHVTKMLNSKQSSLCFVGLKLLHILSLIDKKYLTPNSKLIVQHLASKNKQLSDSSFKLVLLLTNESNVETVFQMITQRLDETSANSNHVDNYLKLISHHNQSGDWKLAKLNQLFSIVQVTPEIMDKTYFALERFETKSLVELWEHVSKDISVIQLDLNLVCLAIRPAEVTENLADIYSQVGSSIVADKSNSDLYETRVSWYLTSLRPLGIYSKISLSFNDGASFNDSATFDGSSLINQVLLADTQSSATFISTPTQINKHADVIDDYLQKSESCEKIRKPAVRRVTEESAGLEAKQSVSQAEFESVGDILNKPAKRVWSKQGHDKSTNSLSTPTLSAQHEDLSNPSSKVSDLSSELLKSLQS